MNWTDEPATWKQMKYLKQLGFKQEHPLTKVEAANLIRNFGGHPKLQTPGASSSLDEVAERREAYELRIAVEKVRRGVADAEKNQVENAQQELARAIAKRQAFWVDTCRDEGKVLVASVQGHKLYQKQGCRFDTPTPKDVQYILDALDSAMPAWDLDHPELFYQTLELNFPELLRRR
jgi:hypothetical protein